MKLFEIIASDQFRKSARSDRYHGSHWAGDDQQADDDGETRTTRGLEKRDKTGKVKRLGSGHFSSVYRHKDNPHDVTKISGERSETNPDGFQALITAMREDEDIQSNPYLPKIRSVRNIMTTEPEREPGEVDDGAPGRAFIAKTEALHHMSKLRLSEVRLMIKRMFKGKLLEEMLDSINEDNFDEYSINEIADTISLQIKTDRFREDIRDPHLIQVADFIRQTGNDYGFNVDLHGENIMFRRTPHGPHLVISDPLGFSSATR